MKRDGEPEQSASDTSGWPLHWTVPQALRTARRMLWVAADQALLQAGVPGALSGAIYLAKLCRGLPRASSTRRSTPNVRT